MLLLSHSLACALAADKETGSRLKANNAWCNRGWPGVLVATVWGHARMHAWRCWLKCNATHDAHMLS